jgi:hypothetical protein
MKLEIYAGLTATLRPYNEELEQAIVEEYGTVAGGLYGAMEIFLPTDPVRPYQWQGGDRVVLRDGLDIAWEGVVATVNYAQRDSAKGLSLSCVGAQSLLQKTVIDKRWADNRVSADAWPELTTAALAETVRIDRLNRIRFTPGAGAEVTTGQNAIVRYTMPTGRTIKRIAFNYALERIATWSAREVRNNALTVLSNTTDGSAATSTTITIASGEYLYIGSSVEFDRVIFDFGGTVNANAATISGDYIQAESHTWQPLTGIADGTALAGAPLAQDGSIVFTKPTDWASDGLVGSRAFWIRLSPSATLTTSVAIVEITVGVLQDWQLRLVDATGPTNLWTTAVSGTGSQNITLGTPRQSLDLRLTALSKFVTVGNAAVYGQFTSVTVYDELGNIYAGEVAKDVRALAPMLNTDESQIAEPGYSLVPFVSAGQENIASILDRALAFGDTDGDAWGWSIANSETAVTPDGKPVLRVAELPKLTDYDYTIRFGEAGLGAPFELVLDYDAIVNSVFVSYQTSDGTAVLTPTDQPTLENAASVAAYGRQARALSLGNTSSAAALAFGQAFLAANKDPRFIVSGPLLVTGSIRTKGGGVIAASRIEAGKRIRIENYLDSIAGADGLIFLITATSYSTETKTCSISTGRGYDDLAVMLAQMGTGAGSGSSSGGGSGSAIGMSIIDPAVAGNLVTQTAEGGLVDAGYADDSIFYVEKYGGIQAAINAANAAGGGTVRLRSHTTYAVTISGGKALTVYPGITIDGNGATIRLVNAAGNYETIFSGATAGADLSNLTIKNLTIDQNSTNNTVTNTGQLSGNPRFAIRIYAGRHIRIQDCTFRDIQAVNTVVANGTTVSDVHVTGCKFYDVGGGTVDFDHSTIYFQGKIGVFSANTFQASSTLANGARTAIEMHGSQWVVSDNTITDYMIGIIPTGVAPETVGTVVANNTIRNCRFGIVLYANNYTPQDSDFGIDGMTIIGNQIYIVDRSAFGASLPMGGVIIDNNADLPIRNLRISNNTIAVPLQTSIPTDTNASLGIGMWSLAGISMSNVAIENNTVINFPLAAIRLSVGDLSESRICNNVLTNPGSTLDTSRAESFRSGVVVVAANVSGLEIDNNQIIDNLDTSRIKFGIYILVSTSSEGLYIRDNVIAATGSTTTSLLYQILPSTNVPLPFLRGVMTGWIVPGTNFAAGSEVRDGGRVYTNSTGGAVWPSKSWGSAAPTTGTYARGSVVYTNSATATGYRGWICVTAGSPGTWKTWGAIDA